MVRTLTIGWAVVLGGLLGIVSRAGAQQVTISVPQQNYSGGWYEYIGGRWVYFGPGFSFNFGGTPPPQFGGFDPAGGLTTGFSFGGGGTGGAFQFSAGTGGSDIYTSTTPMLTVTNGVPGSIFIGRTTPFVTGLAPVLAADPRVNPAFANLGPANTIAGRWQRGEMHIRNGRVLPGPDPQLVLPADLAAPPNLWPAAAAPLPQAVGPAADDPLAVLEKPAAIDRSNEGSAAAKLLVKGRGLRQAGKPGAAKLLLEMAARQATGSLREDILAELQALPEIPQRRAP